MWSFLKKWTAEKQRFYCRSRGFWSGRDGRVCVQSFYCCSTSWAAASTCEASPDNQVWSEPIQRFSRWSRLTEQNTQTATLDVHRWRRVFKSGVLTSTLTSTLMYHYNRIHGWGYRLAGMKTAGIHCFPAQTQTQIFISTRTLQFMMT